MDFDLLPLVADQIKVGQPLPFGVRDEHGTLLLAVGHLIATSDQRDTLLSRGLYADRAELAAAFNEPLPATSAEPPTLFEQWERIIWRLDALLKGMHPGTGFVSRCDELVTEFAALVERDPDVAIFLSVRQNNQRLKLYGLTHALHCALVCLLMGRRVGWPEARTRMLVKAALTMNVAIIDAQGRFAAQGPLSDADRTLISEHPERAVSLLSAAGVDDAEWLQAVLEHHEHIGGAGYPARLAQPCEAAMALHMADVFMAKISRRAERGALTIQEAARQLFTQSKGSPLAAAVIKEFGIYPPGNVVKLATGELAIVIRRGATAHTPIAAAFTDTTGRLRNHATRRDTAQLDFGILSIPSDGLAPLRISPERLFALAI